MSGIQTLNGSVFWCAPINTLEEAMRAKHALAGEWSFYRVASGGFGGFDQLLLLAIIVSSVFGVWACFCACAAHERFERFDVLKKTTEEKEYKKV